LARFLLPYYRCVSRFAPDAPTFVTMEETEMRKSILTIVMLTSALALGACDTDEDFDDQVEDAAEEVEDAAEEIDD